MSQVSLLDLLCEKALKNQIPLSVHFDLTYNCNLNCIHCYLVKDKRPELTTSQIKNILDQLASAGTLYLTLSGGELFTRKDFFEIAEYARNLNFSLRISTNGTLIDDDLGNKIAALNPEIIKLSIYSIKDAIHDKITNIPGSLKKTINAIKILKDKNLKVKINCIIMKQNLNEYIKVYELSKQLGVSFQLDPHITTKTNGDKAPLNFQINEKELFLLHEKTLKMQSEIEINSKEIDHDIEYHDILCSAGHYSCYISPYGDIYPCIELPILCGNLKETSFDQIWNYSQQLSELRKLKFSNLPICSHCELREHCSFCPGISYLEEGDISIPSKKICREAEILSKIKKSI